MTIMDKNIGADALITSTKMALANGKVLIGNSSGKAAAVTLSGDVTTDNAGVTAIGAAKVTNAMLAGSITQANLTAASLDGTVAKVVADANLIGGIPVLHRINVPAGTTGDVDTVLTHKTRVCFAWLVKTSAAGGGAGTIQLKNGANAISNAISIDVNDQTVAVIGTIDDAQHEIAAAGTLKITRTRTASTDEACTVYVLGVRVS